MSLDTDTAQGRFILQVLGAVAEHEREVMLERQREGVTKAKAEGKYKGRARTAMAKASEGRGATAERTATTEQPVPSPIWGKSSRAMVFLGNPSTRTSLRTPGAGPCLGGPRQL